MHADYETKIHFSGTDEECSAFLEVLKLYTDREHSGAYFDLYDIDDICRQKSNTFDIATGGPWGSYCELNDVDLFREIAEAAPNADFKGLITGSGTYEDQELKAILKDRKLYIETFFFCYEDADDNYSEYVSGKLPFSDFVQMFKIDDEEFDSDAYEEGLSELIMSDEDMSIGEFSFEEFCDAFGEGLFDEDTYNEAIAKIKDLGIKSAYEYRETENPGSTDRFIYDPVAKEYVKGNPFPSGVVDMTDAFAEQLEKQGSNKDPDDLSVEEAYDLLAEMMSGEDNGEPDAKTEALFKDLFADDFFSGF